MQVPLQLVLWQQQETDQLWQLQEKLMSQQQLELVVLCINSKAIWYDLQVSQQSNSYLPQICFNTYQNNKFIDMFFSNMTKFLIKAYLCIVKNAKICPF